MQKPRMPALNANQARIIQSAVEAERHLDRLSVGGWKPNVDICETPGTLTVRIELPGVDCSEVSLTLQDGILRVQGVKQEATPFAKLLCYYCLERRYGRFDRSVPVHWVVDARKAQAVLANGVLTVTLPKIEDRRGQLVQIAIKRKEG